MPESTLVPTPLSSPITTPAGQVSQGFVVAQNCEAEIDDDLTPYGECIGHAIDRLPGQHLTILGLYFQAWLMADLAARQGGMPAIQLRRRYLLALKRSLRTTGWEVKQLCKVKGLTCQPIKERMRHKI